MEHLPLGVADKEGCFVYQISCEGRIGVRSALNIGDEFMTKKSFTEGELVSIDLIRPSRSKGSKNGPFLRLSDCSGWLFEKKYGDVMMKRIHVCTGLWAFVVDNAPRGIALRRHPIDRSDMHVKDVSYKPMQKIYCDRKVEHPSTGINFYRVQGTEGWVFDRRLSDDGDEHYMLLEESMVETGLFVYECIHDNDISIRRSPNIEDDDDNTTDLSVNSGQLICADVIRKSPFPHGNGPFLRLSDGSGWLFENKRNRQRMRRVSVTRGEYELEVLHDVALRRQPIDSKKFKEPTVYAEGETIRCTHMAQASSGVKFYRVKGTNGWVFDSRDRYDVLELLSKRDFVENGPAFSITGAGTGWSPDFVRGIAAASTGVSELYFNEHSRVISFVSKEANDVRINVYYTTRTIGTALTHPSQGATQLFRRNCTKEELMKIFENPRAHTGKGYKRRRENPSPSASAKVVYTPYGKGLLADQESELREELIDLDEAIDSIVEKKKRILDQIRDADLERANESAAFAQIVNKRENEYTERMREVKEILAKAERLLQAAGEEVQRREQELRNRTCPVCSRVFQNWHAKQQHFHAVHVFKCDECYKEFDNMHSLNQHKNALNHW